MHGQFPGLLSQKEVGCQFLRISFPQHPVSGTLFPLPPLFCPHYLTPHTFLAGGEVKLKSSNPFDPPIINPNYLTTDFDIKTIVAALKAAQRFVTAKAWQGFVLGAWEQPTAASTDEEFIQYARNHSSAYVEPLDWFLLTSSNIVGRV